MHDAEKVVTLVTISLAIIALVAGYIVAVLVAKPYATLITLGMFLLVVFVVVLLTLSHLRTAKNERRLRHKRVLYHEELPLSANGTPYYAPAEMEVYPQGYAHPQPKQGGSYGGY